MDSAAIFYKEAGGSRNRQVGLGNIVRHPDYQKGKIHIKFVLFLQLLLRMFSLFYLLTLLFIFVGKAIPSVAVENAKLKQTLQSMQSQLHTQEERLTQMSQQMSEQQEQWRQQVNEMMAQQAATLSQQFAQEMQRQMAALKASSSLQRSSASVHPPNDDDDGDDNENFDITALNGP